MWPPSGVGQRAPLHAVDRPEVAVGPGPLVPDRHAALLQPARVAVAAQEPQQLEDDRLEVHLLGRDERKALAQVEAHLVAEHAASCRCRCGRPWPRRASCTWRMKSSYWWRTGCAVEGIQQAPKSVSSAARITARRSRRLAIDRFTPSLPARAAGSRRAGSSRARPRSSCRRSVRARRGRWPRCGPGRCRDRRDRSRRCARAAATAGR